MVARSPRLSRRAVLVGLAAAMAPAWASIAPRPELAAWLPGARLQGAGRMSYLGLRVYDIRLWVGEGFAADRFAQTPLAIEIVYARALSGRRIAERSLAEMQRIAPIAPAQAAAWLAAMHEAFPDVNAGDRLTGLLQPGEGVRFFHNDRLRFEVADAAFASAFFAIWLSPATSEPKLRLALLGGSA
jgi:hypothetical protein